MNNHLKKSNHSLTPEQIKRIHFYTMQSCITNSWFCTLRGIRPDSGEIKQAIYIGAITPLLDDLVDSSGLKSTEITELLNQNFDDNSDIKLLIRYLYQKITNNCTAEFHILFNKALIAQDASLKQMEKEKLNIDQLFEITQNKGACWTLLYRSVLKNKPNPGEELVISTLGTLLQLTNDAFDVYKDFQNGQQSIYTISIDLEPLNAQFTDLCRQMIMQMMELDYPLEQKKKALIQIMLIISRGIVCMEQLLNCQKKKSNQFQIEMYKRKELICDMEKISNILKSIRICYSFLD